MVGSPYPPRQIVQGGSPPRSQSGIPIPRFNPQPVPVQGYRPSPQDMMQQLQIPEIVSRYGLDAKYRSLSEDVRNDKLSEDAANRQLNEEIKKAQINEYKRSGYTSSGTVPKEYRDQISLPVDLRSIGVDESSYQRMVFERSMGLKSEEQTDRWMQSLVDSALRSGDPKPDTDFIKKHGSFGEKGDLSWDELRKQDPQGYMLDVKRTKQGEFEVYHDFDKSWTGDVLKNIGGVKKNQPVLGNILEGGFGFFSSAANLGKSVINVVGAVIVDPVAGAVTGGKWKGKPMVIESFTAWDAIDKPKLRQHPSFIAGGLGWDAANILAGSGAVSQGIHSVKAVAPAVGKIIEKGMQYGGLALVGSQSVSTVRSGLDKGDWSPALKQGGQMLFALPFAAAGWKWGAKTGTAAATGWMERKGIEPSQFGMKTVNKLSIAKSKLFHREVSADLYHQRDHKGEWVAKTQKGSPEEMRLAVDKSRDPLSGDIVVTHGKQGMTLSKYHREPVKPVTLSDGRTPYGAAVKRKDHPLNTVFRSKDDKVILQAAQRSDVIYTGSGAMKLQTPKSLKWYRRKVGDVDFLVQGGSKKAQVEAERFANVMTELTGRKHYANPMKHEGSFRIHDSVRKKNIVDITATDSPFIGESFSSYGRNVPVRTIEGLKVADVEFLFERKMLMAHYGKNLDKTVGDLDIMSRYSKSQLDQFQPVYKGEILKPARIGGENVIGSSPYRVSPEGIREPFLWVTEKGGGHTWMWEMRGKTPTEYKFSLFRRKSKPVEVEIGGVKGAKRVAGAKDLSHDRFIDRAYSYENKMREPFAWVSHRTEKLGTTETDDVLLAGNILRKNPQGYNVHLREVPSTFSGRVKDSYYKLMSKLTGYSDFYVMDDVPVAVKSFTIFDPSKAPRSGLIHDTTAAGGLVAPVGKSTSGGFSKALREQYDFARNISYIPVSDVVGVSGLFSGFVSDKVDYKVVLDPVRVSRFDGSYRSERVFSMDPVDRSMGLLREKEGVFPMEYKERSVGLLREKEGVFPMDPVDRSMGLLREKEGVFPMEYKERPVGLLREKEGVFPMEYKERSVRYKVKTDERISQLPDSRDLIRDMERITPVKDRRYTIPDYTRYSVNIDTVQRPLKNISEEKITYRRRYPTLFEDISYPVEDTILNVSQGNVLIDFDLMLKGKKTRSMVDLDVRPDFSDVDAVMDPFGRSRKHPIRSFVKVLEEFKI
jgi:hypothetical protein